MSIDSHWDMAIERNRKPLLRIIATLFAAIGLGEGKAVERLAWPLYRMVLSILIPAESAVRRLIVVAARNLVVTPPPSRPASKERKASGKGKGKTRGRAAFQLFDPRKRFAWEYGPTIDGVTPDPRFEGRAGPRKNPRFRAPPPLAPAHDGTASAASLCRRLLAIKGALDDLGAQARRYARWRAKPFEQRRPQFTSSLRPGAAPGRRKKPSHEVDLILNECHELAFDVPKPGPKPGPKPDTS